MSIVHCSCLTASSTINLNAHTNKGEICFVFDTDQFIQDCLNSAREEPDAIREVLQKTISDNTAAISEHKAFQQLGIVPLYRSARLTIIHYAWPGCTGDTGRKRPKKIARIQYHYLNSFNLSLPFCRRCTKQLVCKFHVPCCRLNLNNIGHGNNQGGICSGFAECIDCNGKSNG